ncbi:MAG TPA: glycosyltransferase family 1 protein [Mycobacteriales bacterium]|nr:glycosyltransferase family 1 protein [Mycobacteriales bacterium]
MRVGLDATPLLGTRTGVGHYVAELLAALPPEVEPVLTAFTWRGVGGLPRGHAVAPRRFSARALQTLWANADLPPVEWLSGRVDVFHGTNFVLPPTRRAAGVVTIHDLSYEQHADTVTPATLRYRALVPRALRRGGLVLTPSNAVAAEVRTRYDLPEERVLVTPLGVAPRWFADPGPRPAWLPERYVLFVGNLEPRKNVPVLLRAMASLHATDPAAPPVVLAGPAGWGPALDASGLPRDAVVTPGYVGGADLVAAVAHASVLAFPSRYEGFGLPPLEALATGTPVVASDLAVLREVLGEHAAFVPVGDAEALAAALAKALADGDGGPAARAERAAHARAFTWARCAAETARGYARALALRSGA